MQPNYLIHGEFKLKVAYDPEIVSEEVVSSITRGAYERIECRNLLKLVEDGERILEFGAGVGFVSALLSLNKQIDSYHVVEADARLLPLFRQTHALNDVARPVVVHNCIVVSDEELIRAGTQKFRISRKFCASGTRCETGIIAEVDIEVRSLASFIEEYRPTCIIADIEGSEVDLFAKAELPGVNKVLMELHPSRIGQKGIRAVFKSMFRNDLIFEPKWSSGAAVGFRKLKSKVTPLKQPQEVA